MLAEYEACCGLPKFELGDLESVATPKGKNGPALGALVYQLLRSRSTPPGSPP